MLMLSILIKFSTVNPVDIVYKLKQLFKWKIRLSVKLLGIFFANPLEHQR